MAIIISLKGPDENAAETCRGALREQGKLILNLNVEHVCEMLHAKDEASELGSAKSIDPEETLFTVLDEMLMRIERWRRSPEASEAEVQAPPQTGRSREVASPHGAAGFTARVGYSAA